MKEVKYANIKTIVIEPV